MARVEFSRLLSSLVLVFITLDSLVLARANGLIRLPQELSQVQRVRQGAQIVVQQYEEWARQTQVGDDPQVQQALSRWQAEAHSVLAVVDVARLISQSREVQQTISRAIERRQRNIIVDMLAADPGVRRWWAPTVTFYVVGGTPGIRVLQQQAVVTTPTIEAIAHRPELAGFAQILELEVSQGRLRLVSQDDQWQRLQQLQAEMLILQHSLDRIKQLAALSAVTGPGVVVEASDRPGGYLWDEIVHEEDIETIVSSLADAGAIGIEVGGVRWNAQSWIRCIGPVIVVNGKTVSANPVVVRAVLPVGQDPQRLVEALSAVQRSFAQLGKRLAIHPERELTLPASPTTTPTSP
ncbi:MAG: DUF881 domain-containing protein [Limnochordaceae bacterium]|nr:DUF881 domain-containing protein [Limnochordaceae bacterium]